MTDDQYKKSVLSFDFSETSKVKNISLDRYTRGHVKSVSLKRKDNGAPLQFTIIINGHVCGIRATGGIATFDRTKSTVSLYRLMQEIAADDDRGSMVSMRLTSLQKETSYNFAHNDHIDAVLDEPESLDTEFELCFTHWNIEDCSRYGLSPLVVEGSTTVSFCAARMIETHASGFITRIAVDDDVGEFRLMIDGYLIPLESSKGVLTVADIMVSEACMTATLQSLLTATRSREFIQPRNTLNGYLLSSIMLVFEKPISKKFNVTIFCARDNAIGWMSSTGATAEEAGVQLPTRTE